jgi:uncharacterized protein YjbI with pentapeptide repeats
VKQQLINALNIDIAIVAAAYVIYAAWVFCSRPAVTKNASDADGGASKTQERTPPSSFVIKVLGSTAVLGLLGTILQVVASRSQSNRLNAYEHHRKGLESLNSSKYSTVVHVGSIYALGSLAQEVPELEFTIANELAEEASPRAGQFLRATASQSALPNDPASAEAQAALQVIGNMKIMVEGLPLRLSAGRFASITIPNALLNGVDLSNAVLDGSDLYSVHLYNANLRGASLNGANLTNAVLSSVQLDGATLCPAVNEVVPFLNTGEPVPAQLAGSKLDKARFNGAWMVDAFFSSAQNSPQDGRTYLHSAHFVDANLEGAQFERAILDYADLRGANLTDANFKEASLVGVKIDKNTRLCRTKGLEGLDQRPDCKSKTPMDLKSVKCLRSQNWRNDDNSHGFHATSLVAPDQAECKEYRHDNTLILVCPAVSEP